MRSENAQMGATIQATAGLQTRLQQESCAAIFQLFERDPFGCFEIKIRNIFDIRLLAVAWKRSDVKH